MKAKPIFNVNKVFLKVFGCSSALVAARAIVTPFISPHRFKLHFKKETIKEFSGELYRGFTGRFQNKNITVIRTGIGGQVLGDCLFFLKQARVSEAVFLGSAGGLGDFKIGDLILVTRSSGQMDNFSYSLPEKKYFQKFKNYFRPAGKNYQFQIDEGDIFSLASLFDQNRIFLKRLRKLGFSGLDLESAYFYRAAGINKMKAAGLCAVSDLPLKKPIGELDKKERNCFLNTLDFSIINILRFLNRDDQ